MQKSLAGYADRVPKLWGVARIAVVLIVFLVSGTYLFFLFLLIVFVHLYWCSNGCIFRFLRL
jgi:hypothetical protein